MNYKENLMDDIKGFVGKFVRNPFKTALIALLIYKVLSSDDNKFKK